MLRSVPLPLPPARYQWRDLTADDRGHLFALLRDVVDQRALLFSLDRETLAVIGQNDQLSYDPVVLFPLANGDLGVLDEISNDLMLVDPSDATVRALLAFRVPCENDRPRVRRIAYDEASRLFALTAFEPDGGMRIIPERLDACRIARFYDRPADAYAIERWDDRFLVGATEPSGDRTAMLALADFEEARFLPGVVEIGRGPIDDLERDTEGRIWMTLPWTGQVVRAAPR